MFIVHIRLVLKLICTRFDYTSLQMLSRLWARIILFTHINMNWNITRNEQECESKKKKKWCHSKTLIKMMSWKWLRAHCTIAFAAYSKRVPNVEKKNENLMVWRHWYENKSMGCINQAVNSTNVNQQSATKNVRCV